MGLFNHPKRKLRKMVSKGDYKEALEFASELEPKMGKDPDFLFIVGAIHYSLGSANNAIHYFDRVLQIYPDTEAMMLKANSHTVLNENDEAKRCCRQILEADPEHKDARELAEKLG